MGKGSNPRPFDIPREQYRENFDAIFGKKKKEPQPQDHRDPKPTPNIQ